jgi:hypothetical protein
MLPHQQRVIDEKAELDERATKLSNFISTCPVFESLDPAERERMKEQCEIMWQYSEILGKRIAAFPDAEGNAMAREKANKVSDREYVVITRQSLTELSRISEDARALAERVDKVFWDGIAVVPVSDLRKAIEPVLSWFDMDGEEGDPMNVVSVIGEIATYLEEDRRDLLLYRKALRAILTARDLAMAKAIARDEVERHVESA